MECSTLTASDFEEIFSHQNGAGSFYVLAVTCSGLNYLEALERVFADSLNERTRRREAMHTWLRLEPRLYQYVRQETPLSLYDAEYQKELDAYIRLREIWLDAASCTFTRQRLTFLLELLHLYHNDVCQNLPARDSEADQLEKRLFHDYLLYDMGLENTQFVGREAVSNGYYECDFTLEIEDILKEPHQAIPRRCYRYLKRCLDESRIARCCAAWLHAHRRDLRRNHWIVDEKDIETSYSRGDDPTITTDMLEELDETYTFDA